MNRFLSNIALVIALWYASRGIAVGESVFATYPTSALEGELIIVRNGEHKKLLEYRKALYFGVNQDKLVVMYYPSETTTGNTRERTRNVRVYDGATGVQEYDYAIKESVFVSLLANQSEDFDALAYNREDKAVFLMALHEKDRTGQGPTVFDVYRISPAMPSLEVFRRGKSLRHADLNFAKIIPLPGGIAVYDDRGICQPIIFTNQDFNVTFSGMFEPEVARLAPIGPSNPTHRFIYVDDTGLFCWSNDGYIQRLSGSTVSDVRFEPAFDVKSRLSRVRAARHNGRSLLSCTAGARSEEMNAVLAYDPTLRRVVYEYKLPGSPADAILGLDFGKVYILDTAASELFCIDTKSGSRVYTSRLEKSVGRKGQSFILGAWQ